MKIKLKPRIICGYIATVLFCLMLLPQLYKSITTNSGDEKYFTNFEKGKAYIRRKNKNINSGIVWVLRNNSGRKVIIAR